MPVCTYLAFGSTTLALARPSPIGSTCRCSLVRLTTSMYSRYFFFFFFNDPAPTEISPLSLPDALPILIAWVRSMCSCLTAVPSLHPNQLCPRPAGGRPTPLMRCRREEKIWGAGPQSAPYSRPPIPCKIGRAHV